MKFSSYMQSWIDLHSLTLCKSMPNIFMIPELNVFTELSSYAVIA